MGADKPNIVIILSDDQGYADVSYNPHSPPEVSTPHIDALADSSTICTQGYTSGHVCSPTRAGLMTGRYQQRFGIYTAGEGGSGVPLDEVFIPERLKPAGYVSGALGKWHLGLTEEYHAMNRGFDEFYGFMGRGAHPYFDHSDMSHPIYRGLTPIKEEGYLTTRITEEAVDFIGRHKDEPFFLYVAYNAVHAPPEAPKEDIKQVTGDETRDTLMAMIKHLDMGVGEIVNSLKKHNIFKILCSSFLLTTVARVPCTPTTHPFVVLSRWTTRAEFMSLLLCRGRLNSTAGKSATSPCGRSICLLQPSTLPGFPCRKTNLWMEQASCPHSEVTQTYCTTSCTGVLREPKESGPSVPETGNSSQRRIALSSLILKKISVKPLTLLRKTQKWLPNSRANTTHGLTKWPTQ